VEGNLSQPREVNLSRLKLSENRILNFSFVELCEAATTLPRRRKNTIHESVKVSLNFIEIFRPRRDLNVQFLELYS